MDERQRRVGLNEVLSRDANERESYVIVEKLPGGPAGLAIREDPTN